MGSLVDRAAIQSLLVELLDRLVSDLPLNPVLVKCR